MTESDYKFVTMSSQRDHDAVCKILADLENDPKSVTAEEAYTSLRYGEELRAIAVIAALGKKGASLDEVLSAGCTLLTYAASGSNFMAVVTLLENGADPSVPDADGHLPAYYARGTVMDSILRNAGGYSDEKNPFERMPVHTMHYEVTPAERLALSYAVLHAMHDDVDCTDQVKLITWTVVNWYVKHHCNDFSLLRLMHISINAALLIGADAELTEADLSNLALDNHIVMLTEADGEMLRFISTESFRISASALFHHDLDERGYVLRDLIWNGPAYVLIPRDSVTEELDYFEPCGWGQFSD